MLPSEVARLQQPDSWRDNMPAVRSAAQALAREGRLEICQRGQVRQTCAHKLRKMALALALR
jgi:Protein of unknown function (DUF3253)